MFLEWPSQGLDLYPYVMKGPESGKPNIILNLNVFCNEELVKTPTV